MRSVLEQLKDAVTAANKGGKSRGQICRDGGVAESQLSRLMSGEQGVKVPALERLAKALGYSVVLKRKGR